MKTEHVCRRCGTRQQQASCGDCETTICVVCYDRCRRCNKPLCDKHFERSEGRGGICDECLKVRKEYLWEAARVFSRHEGSAETAGAVELAKLFKRAGNILGDMEHWESLLERRRVELETRPDTRSEDLTRQLSELQREEVALHAARRAAEDASAAKSRFVAQVSHEIRTPMNAVVAMADLLSRTKLDDQQHKFVDAIRRSGDHLVRIVGDILDYSKIEAGRLSIDTIPFDLEAAVIDVVEILSSRAAEKGLPLVCRYAPDASRKLMGDPGRIRQVLMNLIGNAIKFTHSGSVCVLVEQLGIAQNRAVMRITVLDTGIGIPRDKYPAIFEQFDQGGAATFREYGGTGLGLAITNQLVRLMGGRVGLSSREGNGSRFRVTIAMKLAEDAQLDSASPAPLAGRRIMIADPIKVSGDMLAAHARALGARTLVAADRSRIMESLVTAQEEKDPFDAVWVHHVPHVLDAASIGSAVRKSELFPRTMLCCFASAGLDDNRSLFEEVGFNAYFHGPCPVSEIDSTLERACAAFYASETNHLTTTGGAQRPEETLSWLEPSESNPPRYRVLVVEDRPVNQEVAAAIFQSLGCEIVIAADGHDALRQFADSRFDIVFMDCQLPGMDGYETTRRLRQSGRRGAAVPIIAMTASAAHGYRDQCLQASMNDYITKPVTRRLVAAAIERWLVANDSRIQLANGPLRDVPIPEASGDILDRNGALASMGGKSAILERVTAVFLNSVPEEVAALESAISSGQHQEIERLAHSIKSAAASLGGQRVSLLAEQLERAGHSADLELAQSLYPSFDDAFAALSQALSTTNWAGAN